MLNLLALTPFLIKGIIDYKRQENEREHIEKQRELEDAQNKEKERQFQEYKNQIKEQTLSSAKANMARRGINLTSDMARANLKAASYNIDRELENFNRNQNLKTQTRDNHYNNLLDKNFYQTLRQPFNL